MDGKSIHELFESEQVTIAAGVPTVWLALINYLKSHQLKFSTLKTVVVGGSAIPPSMMQTFNNDYDVDVINVWGMTEMSPFGAINTPKGKHQLLDPSEQFKNRLNQGRSPFGVEMKIIDDEGQTLPRDGAKSGNLVVRGPWVASEYFKGEGFWMTRVGSLQAMLAQLIPTDISN